MSKQDIWMPLYIADYLADTTRLTTEQHGAYLLLIMDYWRNGPLPDDDALLSNITRLTVPVWKKSRAALQRMFVVSGGEWRHKRIDKELLEAAENSEKRKKRAQAAAEKRWGNSCQNDATSNATSIPPSNAPGCATSDAKSILEQCPSPSPSPSPKKPKSEQVSSTAVTPAGAVCARLRSLQIQGVNPSHPKLLALLKAGITEDELVGIAEEPSAKGKSLPWLLAAAEGRRRDAAVENLPAKYEKPWFMTATGIEEKAAELGIGMLSGEIFPAFKARVFGAACVTDEMVRKAKIDAGERV